MRIFIGLTEIANITYTYSKAFRELGHETLTAIDTENPFYPDSKYDCILSQTSKHRLNATSFQNTLQYLRLKTTSALFFPTVFQTCDLFIFVWGTSFLPFFWDYSILKRRGKKIVSTFWGSEIRYAPALEQELNKMGIAEDFRPFLNYLYSLPERRQKYLNIVRAAERNSDLILSQAGYGQLQSRPYMRANVPIDLSMYRPHVPGRKIPKIIHAPSRRNVKGTSYVLEAVAQLKNEGIDFEFLLLENTSNKQIREILTDVDIVIDQLFSETVGLLSAEAMASGCVTLVHYIPDYSKVPERCPAVDVTKDTLVDQLRKVILDLELRCRLAAAGRPYVEANNDHVKVAKKILEWLDQKDSLQYDYVPETIPGGHFQ